MITEDYVSFKTAKLLKEKGFDEACRAFWKDWDDSIVLCKCDGFHTIDYCFNSMLEDYNDAEETNIAAPTLQMAMKWLREIHKLGVFPTTYYREINRNVKHDYGSTIVRLDTHEIIGNDKNIKDYTFEAKTYEETAEKAIRYCLENLI